MSITKAISTLFLCVNLFTLLSGLDIEKKCGETVEIQFNQDAIARSVYFYFPKILCDETKFAQFIIENSDLTTFDPSSQSVNYPILLAIHYLGGDGNEQINRYKAYSESIGFIIVAPNGGSSNMKRSWNANYCCDPALSRDLDDISYLNDIIINTMQKDIPNIFPFLQFETSHINEKSDIIMGGYSNGGFMSDKLAWLSATEQFPYITAVAPMAGYAYDPFHDYFNNVNNGNNNNNKLTENDIKDVNFNINDKNDKYHKIGTFLHISLKDRVVGYNGCCKNNKDENGDIKEGSQCWSGIGTTTDCVSVKDEFKKWFEWNSCDSANLRDNNNNDNGNENDKQLTSDELFDALKVDYTMPNGFNMHCAVATPSEHNCASLVELCLYEKFQHGRGFEDSMGMVVEFFMQSICIQNGGTWNAIKYDDDIDTNDNANNDNNDNNNQLYHTTSPTKNNFLTNCQCSESSNNVGPFCMTSKEHLGLTTVVNSDNNNDNNNENKDNMNNDNNNDNNDNDHKNEINNENNGINVGIYQNEQNKEENDENENENENSEDTSLTPDGKNRLSNVGSVHKYSNMSDKEKAKKIPNLAKSNKYEWITIVSVIILTGIIIFTLSTMECVQKKFTFRRRYEQVGAVMEDEFYDQNGDTRSPSNSKNKKLKNGKGPTFTIV